MRPSPGGSLQRNQPHIVQGFLIHLTLTQTQYPVIVSNAGNRKPFVYAGFANPCNAQQLLTAHSQ
jgi:hypothetical protein